LCRKVYGTNQEEFKKVKKFVILTAAYNSSKYIKKWANSIISQTYRPLGVVMVDDLSTDATISMIDKIKKCFKEAKVEFKYIRSLERLYCGSAYKLVQENAKGTYFGVLDSDDMLEPFACEFVANLYDDNPKIDFIYTQFLWCRENMKPIKKGFCRAPGKNESILSMEERRIHCFGHWRTFHNRFLRPEKLFKSGLKCSVDKYMGFRLEEFGRGMFVNKVCYKYRSGTSNSVSKTKVAIDVWKKIIKQAKERRKKYNLEPFKITERM